MYWQGETIGELCTIDAETAWLKYVLLARFIDENFSIHLLFSFKLCNKIFYIILSNCPARKSVEIIEEDT